MIQKRLCRKKLHDRNTTGEYKNGTCRLCHLEKSKLRYQSTREQRRILDHNKHKKARETNPDYWKHRGWWTRYKFSPETYEALVSKQNGVCAICSQPPKKGQILHIDHCHKTGIVRALLCLSCNAGIGQLNDDPILLKKAAAYIESHMAVSMTVEDS